MSIFFTNDFHSHIPDSISFLNTVSSLKKNDQDILVDLGDFSEGTSFFTLYSGSYEKEILKRYYDVALPGNHGFKNIVELFDDGFNVVCSNLYKNKKVFFNKYYLTKQNNEDIAFIGIISEDAFLSIEKKIRTNFSVKNPYKVLPPLIKELKEKNKRVVLLSHSGFEYDMKLAKNMDGIDVILSSHCHSANTYQLVKNTYILKSLEEGKGYGQLDITYAHLKFKFNELLEESELNSNYKYLEKILYDCQNSLSKIILDGNTIYINNRKRFTKELNTFLLTKFNADAALINYSMFRSIKISDNFTYKDLYDFCPFDNSIAVIKVSEEDLRIGLNSMPDDMQEFLVLSGFLKKGSIKSQVVTTTYILNNFFAHLNKKRYTVASNIRELMLEYLTNLNKNDTNWKQD